MSFDNWCHARESESCIFCTNFRFSSYIHFIRFKNIAGKTLVSDIIMIRKCVERKQKALLVVPFVALVKEKIRFLERFLKPLGLKVGGYYANSSSLPFDKVNIAVCTFEQATFRINKLIDEDFDGISKFGIVIVDEIHMVNDPSRGYLIEPLLTKIKFAYEGKIQIVGMSATIPNIQDLSKWLNSVHFESDYRPIQLLEFVKLGNTIYDKKENIVKQLDPPIVSRDGPNHIYKLIQETTAQCNSVLIFCPTKVSCENSSKIVAKLVAIPTGAAVLTGSSAIRRSQ